MEMGQVADDGNAFFRILDMDAGSNGNLFAVGQDGDSLAPSQSVDGKIVQGALGANFGFVGLTATEEPDSESGMGRIFALDAGCSHVDLYVIARNEPGQHTAIHAVGPAMAAVPDPYDSSKQHAVPALGIHALEDVGDSSGADLITVGTRGDELAPQHAIGN